MDSAAARARDIIFAAAIGRAVAADVGPWTLASLLALSGVVLILPGVVLATARWPQPKQAGEIVV